jgi:plastocyanin
MSNIYRTLSASIAIFIVSASVAASAQSAVSTEAAKYGQIVPANSTRKEIVVKPDTKWVNVRDGDTVRFVADGRNFTWHFATYPNTTHLDLATIAPQDFPSGKVTVYVAQNQLYRN